MPKFRETVLEIDLNALTYNFEIISSKTKEETGVMAVVKAFAYGNDAQEIAKHLETLNVNYFAVAYAHEGVALRLAGVTTPILVLHPQPINFKLLIQHCLEPSLYSFRVLNEFLNVAQKEQQNNYPVHIKFNTGLNRLGFSATNVSAITSCINQQSYVKVASIFSHLAASEDPNERAFTLQQINTFKSITHQFLNDLNYIPFLHLCNTSGLLNYPEAHFDMIRSGIGLYGFGNDPKFDKSLKPISSLKTCISQIHHLKQGDSLGYNRGFIAEGPMKTATLPIGHADGISRQLGLRKGFVSINDQRAFIIGNVCMDMIMVDVTHITCNEGDEVIIFDPQYSVQDLAEHAKTISYELITSISQRVKRIFSR